MRRLREELERNGSGLENGRSSAIEKLTRKFGALAISLATLVGSLDKADASEGNLDDVTVKNSFVMNDLAHGLDVDEQGNMIEEETPREAGSIVVGNYEILSGGGSGVIILNKNTGEQVAFASPHGSTQFGKPVLYGNKVMVRDNFTNNIYSFDVDKIPTLKDSDLVEQIALYDSGALRYFVPLTLDGEKCNLLWDRRDDTVYALNGDQYVKLSGPNSYVMNLVAEAKSKYVGGRIAGFRADGVTKKIHVFTVDNDTGVATHYVNDQDKEVQVVYPEIIADSDYYLNRQFDRLSVEIENLPEDGVVELGVGGQVFLMESENGKDFSYSFQNDRLDKSDVSSKILVKVDNDVVAEKEITVSVDTIVPEIESISHNMEGEHLVFEMNVLAEDISAIRVKANEMGEGDVILSEMLSQDTNFEVLEDGKIRISLEGMMNQLSGGVTYNFEFTVIDDADNSNLFVYENPVTMPYSEQIEDKDMEGNDSDMGEDMMRPDDMQDMDMETDMEKEDEKADFGYEGPDAEKKDGGGDEEDPSCSVSGINGQNGGTPDPFVPVILGGVAAAAVRRGKKSKENKN